MYRIGTYTDQILNGTRISSLGVRGDTASNAWAADAIGIANAYDPSTADDIGKVYGYDDAGNIANIKMDSQTRQLRNISKALGQSTRKPAAIQGGANLTTTQSTLTINVPAEGLYYITDSAGNPIMIGTKSGNANIMKNDAKDPQWRTLGTAVVKAKIDAADKLAQTAAKTKTDAEAAIKQANTDKTKAAADLADAKTAKAEAEKAKQAALDAKTVSDAKVEAADKQVKAADVAIADAKTAYAKAKDDLNTATGKLNDAQNTIKRLQNAEENLKKANAKLADAQAKLETANKAKAEADKAYEKAKTDYDAKLADKQASDKELANAKQAEAEARKKAEEEAKKQQEAQKKADQAKQDAEAKKQKAEQAKKQAAGVTNNGLASTGSDTTAIATLAAIMTIAGAGCVLVRVRSAKHADGWHAVED
ncbi:hypothetical protein [Bifidobacterium longum]|nr:hypothetical protein [Bifidobacterium longum]